MGRSRSGRTGGVEPATSRFVLVALVACLGSGFLARAVSAQSLAAVARREQARRDRVEAPSKVYTNDDLRPYPKAEKIEGAAPDDTATAGEAATQPESGAQRSKPQTAPEEAPASVRDEAYWRGRVEASRAQLRRNELFQQALQTRVNALTTDFVNTDDPAQRAVVAVDRQRAIEELERVATELDRLREDIADIEEEARRASVPPGWLR